MNFLKIFGFTMMYIGVLTMVLVCNIEVIPEWLTEISTILVAGGVGVIGGLSGNKTKAEEEFENWVLTFFQELSQEHKVQQENKTNTNNNDNNNKDNNNNNQENMNGSNIGYGQWK